jgi:hypothetical protein
VLAVVVVVNEFRKSVLVASACWLAEWSAERERWEFVSRLYWHWRRPDINIP